MGKQLEKRSENNKRKKFMGHPDYEYYSPKTDSRKMENLKSRSLKQGIVNDRQLRRNVRVCEKRKRSYADILKINNSKRREEDKELLDSGYKKNVNPLSANPTK